MRAPRIGNIRILGIGRSKPGDTSQAANLGLPTELAGGDDRLQSLRGLKSNARSAVQPAASESEPDSKPGRPHPMEVQGGLWHAQNGLARRLSAEAGRVSDLATLRALLEPDRPRDTGGARHESDNVESREELNKQVKEFVESGTISDLWPGLQFRVIEVARGQIEAFADDERTEAVMLLIQALEHTGPGHERTTGMVGLAPIIPSLPGPIEPVYDRYFGMMHKAYVSTMQEPNQWLDEPLPFRLHDHEYPEVLAYRAEALVRLNPSRHEDEVRSVLEDIASLLQRHRPKPLAAMAKQLSKPDPEAQEQKMLKLDPQVQAQIFDEIWDALKWGRPMAAKSDELKRAGAIVLPPLAEAVQVLPSLNHRQRMLVRLHAAGRNLGGENGAQTIVNLLPAAKTFSSDASSLAVDFILESLAAMSDDDQPYLHLALIEMDPENLPRIFNTMLERLEDESPEHRSYAREEARAVELRSLILRLGDLEEPAHRDKQFPRLGVLIDTVPPEYHGSPSLYELLGRQVETLSPEEQASNQRWVDAIIGTPPPARY